MCGFQVAQFFHVSLLKLADHGNLLSQPSIELRYLSFLREANVAEATNFGKNLRDLSRFIQDLAILVAFFGMVSSPSP